MPKKAKSKIRFPRLKVTTLGFLILVGISFIPMDALPPFSSPGTNTWSMPGSACCPSPET